MVKPKQQQLANRSRRIPRRVRELQAELKSFDQQVGQIENDPTLGNATKDNCIRRIRDRTGPFHAQIRALVDRG